jgi:peptide/nickel transport system substrate-binding protein
MINRFLGAAFALSCAISTNDPAAAQTLNMMKGIDAPHYDAQRTSWGPTSDIVNMIQDTLVALDWDGKTPIPYLAKSWTVSPDGKLYTFKLRDDVTFCSGKKMTAEDVIFTFRRLTSPEIKGPFAWRAGTIKDLRAPDPYTVEYELAEPFSELLLQLTMFTTAILNKDNVEQLGKDYGVKGADGTGPWCLDSWQPRTQIVLKRHDAYRWGPSMYQNKGPVKFEKLVIKIVPEDSSRVAAMMAGQFDVTHQFPSQFIAQAKTAPMLTVTAARPNFQLLYFGFKTTRPVVADRRVREAMSIAIDRNAIAKSILLGNADPAFTFVDPAALDHDPKTAGLIKEDAERAKKLLDEAGWKPGSDGIREKDGVKLQPRVYYTANANSARVAEAIQGYLRKIGVAWQLQPWDSTIAAAKMAEQDYEIWSVTVPYLSAGDLMNIYFDSKNIPTPNRMNWKDAETDEWLRQGRMALTAGERARFYAQVQQKAMTEHLWMPVLNINMDQVTNKKLKGMRPHMIYQNTFYKGLDASF